jgi:hypothetical protein
MTTKKPLSRLEGMQSWLNNEIEKDKKHLDQEKLKFLNEIKNLKKEDIIPKKIEIKLTLWQRIKKVLTGYLSLIHI